MQKNLICCEYFADPGMLQTRATAHHQGVRGSRRHRRDSWFSPPAAPTNLVIIIPNFPPRLFQSSTLATDMCQADLSHPREASAECAPEDCRSEYRQQLLKHLRGNLPDSVQSVHACWHGMTCVIQEASIPDRTISAEAGAQMMAEAAAAQTSRKKAQQWSVPPRTSVLSSGLPLLLNGYASERGQCGPGNGYRRAATTYTRGQLHKRPERPAHSRRPVVAQCSGCFESPMPCNYVITSSMNA